MNSFCLLWYHSLFKNHKLFEFLEQMKTKMDTEETDLETVTKRTAFLFQPKDNLIPLTPLESILHHEIYGALFYYYQSKYDVLKRKIMTNPFLTDECKENYLLFFGKIQKIYWMFNRLAFRWKYKRAPIAVDSDIYFCPIEPNKSFNCIVYQNQKKFYFKISDLLTIIENACCTTEDSFELCSKYSQNPYTRENLQNIVLYRFYFHVLLYSSIPIPTWFQYFFREHFSLVPFTLKYSCMLKKRAIYKYITSADHNDAGFVNDIRHLIKHNIYTKRWKIDPEFPLSILVDVMRPYIYLFYLTSSADASLDLILYYKTLLNSKLNRLAIFYPCFGRKKEIKWFNNNWKPDFLPEKETEKGSEFFTEYFPFSLPYQA